MGCTQSQCSSIFPFFGLNIDDGIPSHPGLANGVDAKDEEIAVGEDLPDFTVRL